MITIRVIPCKTSNTGTQHPSNSTQSIEEFEIIRGQYLSELEQLRNAYISRFQKVLQNMRSN